MATPQRPPRSRSDDASLRGELVDLVAEKVSLKIDQARVKQQAKIAAQRERLDRDQAKLDKRARREEHAEQALERLAAHLDALEVWTRSAGAGRRPRFTRDEIAATAVHLADTEGFESLSMRRLAAELGAGTMTLYHYVRTKDELLTLVHDAVMGEVLLPIDEPLPDDWRAAITEIALRTRAAFERHPWLLDISDDPPIGPNAVRHFDQTMQAVAPLGLPVWERLDIVTAIDEYTWGFCIHARHHLHGDAGGKSDYSEGLVEYIEGLIATGDYPQLTAMAEENPVAEVLEMTDVHSRDPDRFVRNLDRLLDGIEVDLARRRDEGPG